MLVLALNTGHDGAFAAVEDGKLLFSQEAEKDSFERHSDLNATSMLNAVEHLGEVPDVIAYAGGWNGHSRGRLGAGYVGADQRCVEQRPMNFLGKEVTLVSTTHERAHIMSSIALAPQGRDARCARRWSGRVCSESSTWWTTAAWSSARSRPTTPPERDGPCCSRWPIRRFPTRRPAQGRRRRES